MRIERICYWILIFALGLLLLKLQYCSGRKPCPTITEKIIHDTIETVGPTIEIEKPVPVYIKVPVFTPSGIVTPEEIISNVDSSEIVTDYFTLRSYSNKYSFPDGDIIIENEVFQNSLQNQKVSPVFKRIETTKFITQTDTLYRPLKKTILFVGGGLYGDLSNPFAGGIFGLTLKTKKDLLIGAGRIQNFQGQGNYYIKTDFPIHLKK